MVRRRRSTSHLPRRSRRSSVPPASMSSRAPPARVCPRGIQQVRAMVDGPPVSAPARGQGHGRSDQGVASPRLAVTPTVYDVAVIGAGPAGLAGALALVRSRTRVALFDCWPPRNAAASEVSGFVTQDGTPPAQLRQIAREELAAYPTFELRADARVTAISGERGRFKVTAEHVTIEARRVLLCVGLVDRLPDLPGYRALWGTSLFQCPPSHA